MTNGIRPARLRIYICSLTVWVRVIIWYIVTRLSLLSPSDSPGWLERAGVELGRLALLRCVTAIGSTCLLWLVSSAYSLRAGPPTSVRGSEVDRSTVDGEGGLAEHLRERRVGVCRAADLPRRRLEGEGERGLGDEVGRVRPDDVDAEGVAGLRVADDLREALVLAADDRLGDRLERHLADLEREPALLDLGLGQPDRGDLRPAVGGPRLG